MSSMISDQDWKNVILITLRILIYKINKLCRGSNSWSLFATRSIYMIDIGKQCVNNKCILQMPKGVHQDFARLSRAFVTS